MLSIRVQSNMNDNIAVNIAIVVYFQVIHTLQKLRYEVQINWDERPKLKYQVHGVGFNLWQKL